MLERKNILFLANRVPFPPNKGDKIRTFHQLDHLALSHNIYCACFAETQREQVLASSLRRWCADLVAMPWTRRRGVLQAVAGWRRGLPLTVAAYRDRRMFAALARWAEKVDFDTVVAFSSIMAPYAAAVPAKRRVLDLCDADSEKWMDYARDAGRWMGVCYRSEGRRLRAFEEHCLRKFDATLVITERERALLDPQRRHRQLHVVSNGIVLPDEKPPPPSTRGPVVGFVGAMDYRPNVRGVCWFAEVAWPHILREVPDARFYIIGRAPVRAVRRLARQPGITVTGEVEDVGRYVLKLRVAIAPLHIARGLQNKVLEAMCLRRPVVVAPAVAAGLQAVPGRHLLVARDGETFAARVLDLFRSDEFCDRIGNGGYRCVAAHYSWADALQRYECAVLGKPMPAGPPTILEQELQQMRQGELAVGPGVTAMIPELTSRTVLRERGRRLPIETLTGRVGDHPVPAGRRTLSDLAASFAASQAARPALSSPAVSNTQETSNPPADTPRSPYAALFRGDRPGG